MKNKIKTYTKFGINSLTGVLFLAILMMLALFVFPVSAKASSYYDSGWINVSDFRFTADKYTCPNIGPFAILTANYQGNEWHAWIDLNTPKGSYKVDMKLAHTHKPEYPAQLTETFSLYTKTGITSTYPIPTSYTGKIDVPDMGDTVVENCADVANAFVTYTDIGNGNVNFPENGDVFLEGTGESVRIKAIRVYGHQDAPSLSLTKSVDKSNALPGEEIVYTLTYENTGTDTAYNLWIRDPFTNQNQNYLDFVNAVPSPWGSSNDTWEISNLSPGESGTITITAEINDYLPEGTTVIQNKASIESDKISKFYSNTVSTSVYREPEMYNPELSISKLAKNITQGDSSWQDTVYAQPGDEIQFYIRIHSNGDTGAEDVRVRDYLPSQMEYISGSTSGATAHDITGYWYNIGDINSGSSKTIYLSARIEGEENFSEGYTSLTNRVKAYGDNVSTVEDTARISVFKQASSNVSIYQLMISKLVRNISQEQLGYRESVSILAGDQLEFSIKITNVGNKDLTDITVWDNLNDNLTYIDGSSTIEGVELGDGITGAGVLVGDLDVSESKIIKFRVTVNDSVDNFPPGTRELVNYAYARSVDIPTISDTAAMTVTKGRVLGASTVQTGPVDSLIWSLLISLLATITVFFAIKHREQLNGAYNGLKLKFAVTKARFIDRLKD